MANVSPSPGLVPRKNATIWPLGLIIWSAITVPLLAAVSYKTSSSLRPRLPLSFSEAHHLFSLSLPATYTNATLEDAQYRRVPTPTITSSTGDADTTAVLLNWSRFRNVHDLVNLLCDSSLADVFSQVIVWNNNPKAIHERDFLCPKDKLKIINSAENTYFHARFQACTESNTKYCYIQDDDYLVRPEILRALHAHANKLRSVHLLPPHEHLTSTLRSNTGSKVHTSFAWLGHGTILPRESASSFLALLRSLNASTEEIRMADNYWTVLSNTIPELWFDQGIELSGGEPFTVGEEGHQRNLRHITRATEYLDSVLSCNGPSCPTLPYINALPGPSGRLTHPVDIFRAACLGSPCVLETNVRLLPPELPYEASRAQDMLTLESRGRAALGTTGEAHYVEHPPSAAVDGDIITAFRSRQDAKKGDYIALDLLSPLSNTADGADAEFVLLVPESSFPIYMVSSLQTSTDGQTWTTRHGTWRCAPVGPTQTDHEPRGAPLARSSDGLILQECSVRSLEPESALARWFRIILNDDVQVKWALHEVWMRLPVRF